MTKRIYLDYAATTPVDPVVFSVIAPYFSEKFGNAGSLHSFGQEAIAAIDESREKIAKAIGADFREIIFTGSATEANNLAILGVAKAFKIDRDLKTPKVIISSIEHESVLETARDLARLGIQVIYLRVSEQGLIDLDQLKKELDERVILVSLMYANNEIGAIEPVAKISEIIKNFREKNNSTYPLLHTDAVQAFQYLDSDVKKLGVDLMTLSAHKIYGPKGVGVLYINQNSRIKMQKLGSDLIVPIINGGGQEYGLRSGTENVPSIVGFGRAAELALNIRHKEAERVRGLRDYFWKEIKKIYEKAELNGPSIEIQSKQNRNTTEINRLPNNLNIYFPKQKAEDLLVKFDLAGIAVSAGSACSARGTEPSHVLKACGFPLERIKSSLRITLGRPTTKAEIDEVLKRIKPIF